jgi:hypothetical protein
MPDLAATPERAPLRKITGVTFDGPTVTEMLDCGHSIPWNAALWHHDAEHGRGASSRRCENCAEDEACPICEGGRGPVCPSHFL